MNSSDEEPLSNLLSRLGLGTKKIPEKRKTLSEALELIKTSKKIIVLTGAGISVSCGIPDFRSKNGLYATLAKDYPELPSPQHMFCIDFFKKNPKPFFRFAEEILPGRYQPSVSHKFISFLDEQKKLLRLYSQNIDALERAAGIKNLIEVMWKSARWKMTVILVSWAHLYCTLCEMRQKVQVGGYS